ncbi:hypothetical protein [Nonomuraea guangzhouensis]|uniref:Uncharacterized protein n=1 Tax=Nonomuraea guangzhouensis TaxID=1291555 RepID=A0ABW4GE12_9ACTN|nr:hypothetical protein [Nonomuraea guangzhouensis]
MPKPDEGGTTDGHSMPGVGTPSDERERQNNGEAGFANSTEDYYADYLARPKTDPRVQDDLIEWHRIGDYPTAEPPRQPPVDLVAQYRIDPGTVRKEMSIKIADFVDPETGKPRPDSPVERLRADLDRLRGLGDSPSLEVLVTRATLTDRDLGTWQAAADMKATTDKAQLSLRSAITQLCSVYETIVETLDQTVKTAMDADRSVADGLRKATT